MIKHIVFWNLKDEAEGGTKLENGRIIKQRLEALVGVVDGLLKAEVGFNYNPHGYDLCLYSEFATKEAQEAYQEHPEHLKVREFVRKVITERAVVDFEA
ncbi:MAG TPA: stress responsive protein [Ruminococcaceae bacterium]|nr:stress responsive protein [Oscillospiraceae bacterium]